MMPHCQIFHSKVNLILIKASLFVLIFFSLPNPINISAQSKDLAQSQLREAKQLLLKLGFWTGPVDDSLDEATYYAALAFQRVTHLPKTGILRDSDLNALRHTSPLRPRITGSFHFEVDISQQILFAVLPDGTVAHILPVATGSGNFFTQGGKTRRALTPVGSFTVRRKIDGWRQSPLGLMYYPSYIQGGVAIHGSLRLPKRPLTFGCIAVPLLAAEMLSKQMPIGTVIVIYK
jgi:peptidoglycan hydrolase-like protein with peptidoglycan-binding domain